MSVRLCVALLALCSLAAAADLDCKELMKPLGNRTQVTGKWIFHATVSETEELGEKAKTIKSSQTEIIDVPDSDEMVLHWKDRMMTGECAYGTFNFTFSSNMARGSFDYNSTTFNFTGFYVQSCPHCLIWIETLAQVENGTSLYLFTRNGTLGDPYSETFKKYASCLNLTSEIYFPEPDKQCPDTPEAKVEKEEEEKSGTTPS